MDSITALQRQRNQSRSLVTQETITASQTSSCGTVTVTADDDDPTDPTDPTDPGNPRNGGDGPLLGVGTTPIAIAGGVGLLGVLLLLLN
jgi:hypothetical protein